MMEDLGAQVYEIELPACEYASAASWALAYTESFAIHRDNFFARSRDYTAAFLHKITGAALLTAEERLTAERLRELTTTEFLQALRDVDVIVTPTTSYPAHPIAGRSPESESHSLTRPISLTGLPSLAIPCGFASGGVKRLSILTPDRRAKLTPLSGTAEVVPVVNRVDPRGFV